MKDDKESRKTKKMKESKLNKDKESNINNHNSTDNIKEDTFSLISEKNDKTINEFHGADEFQRKEINKIIRSKYSSQLLSLTQGFSEFHI